MDNKSSNRATKQTKKKKKRNIWKGIWIVFQVCIVLGLMAGLFAGGVAAGFFASHVKDEPLRSYDELYNNIYNFNQTGEAYFKNNEFIGYLRTESVTQPVTEEEVSPHLIDAILATEDNEFYNHKGVNLKATSRAVIEQLTNPGEGSGGSTITQQLVKNKILTPARKFERKFKEMLLAMRVERMFNKEQILEAYMNIIYLGYNANGSNIEGVKAAAEGIFDVAVKDLNVPQSAYIAGMIQSPGRYTPFKRSGSISENNLQLGIERMEYVLNRMFVTNRITQEQYDDALAFDIKKSLAEPTPGIVEKYPFLTFEIEERAKDIIIEQLLEEKGIDRSTLSEEDLKEYEGFARSQLSGGGYKVYTTIDRELYEAFHEVIKNDELFGPRSTENKFVMKDPETGEEKEIGYLEQAAATLIDNDSGAIIAMVEGRDFDELQYNLTTEPRQPGSSIKPILDYAPALELGLLQPASVIEDTPIFKWDVSTDDYWVPKNWYPGYKGLVTTRKALEWSYNVPAIKTFLSVQEKKGAQAPFDYLRKMGITTLKEADFSSTAVAIGGMTRGLTVEENTAAYATFANNGTYVEPYLIERIETLDGEVIYEHEMNPTPVFSEQTAFLMNDMLRTVVKSGTASKIRQGMGPELDIAGKTGTTNNEFDYWFVGYTPQISMGVWNGYPKLESLSAGYSSRNKEIWMQLMKKVQEIRPEYANDKLTFKQPEDIVRRAVCSKSGMLPSELCKEAGFIVTDYFNRKYLPTQTDNSLVKARVIEIDGKRYIAHDTTPDDLVTEGIFVKREPIEVPEEYQEEKEKYLPLDWDTRAPKEMDPREENGKNPGQPPTLKAEWRGETIEAFWHAPYDQDLAGFRLYRAKKDGQFKKVASIPSHLRKAYTDENVQKGEVYAYYVTAVDIAGQESKPSDIVLSNSMNPDEFFAPQVPTAPTGLKGATSIFGVELSWQANPDQEKVSHYNIYYAEDPSNGYRVLDQTSSTTYSHTFLNMPDEYWYYISAVNEAGESKASNTIQVRFKDTNQDAEDSSNSTNSGE